MIAKIYTLKKRLDYLNAAKGLRYVSNSFILQACKHSPSIIESVRFGFTASKKIGNAICRNRAKRRLRALVRNVAFKNTHLNFDYIFIARKNILYITFTKLKKDITIAMLKIHNYKNINNIKSF